MITYEELHRQLYYDSLTGIFIRKVSNTNFVKIGDIAGGFTPKGYITIGINGIRYKAHDLAWLYIYGYFPEEIIDHKDKVKHHNWISNLREISNQCNLRNTGNPKNNTSGVKGVNWNKRDNK